MNTKESLITNYFKPIDKAKHQQQNQHVLKILQLKAKCSKLEKEKWELTKHRNQNIKTRKQMENTRQKNNQNINETRLDNMINDSEIEIDGYEVMRWDRDRNGGGVALYGHKSLDVTI